MMVEFKHIGRQAVVGVSSNGDQILYSYGAPIIRKTSKGVIERILCAWSETTGKHINDFLALVGIKSVDEKWFNSLPIGNMVPWYIPEPVNF